MEICSRLLFRIFLVFVGLFLFREIPSQNLSVSSNGRYLEKNGKPFVYLGDTAWELFHRLNLDEANNYLQNRAAKGFTVIQAVILAQLGGLTEPNTNGDLPLVDKDPYRPVEGYFRHVDSIVKMASALNLVIGMLPTWGSYWSDVNGKEKIFTSENAESFGTFLGNRYRDAPVIWILGGDENINSEEERSIIEAMARGLKKGDLGNHLITFHPRGPGRSSDFFHHAEWLDFNMFQSSHGAHDHDNGLYSEIDYNRFPIKPTLDGEPRYELIPAGFYFAGSNRQDLFDDYDCRQAAYWSVFAGACGHTYGHNSIWQMFDSNRSPVLGATKSWREALDHPGAFQMQHLKELMDSRHFHRWVPDPSLLLNSPGETGSKVRCVRAEDSSYALFYSPRGAPFSVDKSKLNLKKNREIWFDPRYGIYYPVHQSNTLGIQTYNPPTQGRGRDWVLIIEDI